MSLAGFEPTHSTAVTATASERCDVARWQAFHLHINCANTCTDCQVIVINI